MFQICIFDLDGTLTDTLESLTYSVNQTLAEMGLSPITHEQCREFIGNGAAYLIRKSLIAGGDRSASRLQEGMKIYRRIFSENCTYQVEPYEGIPELLTELKRRNFKLAVLSNKPHEQTQKVVQHFFGTKLFDYVQGQCDAIPRKPDPTGAHMIAKQFRVGNEECVYIGDSETDIQTAQAAGMESVGVAWGFRSEQVLREHGAKHIIYKPEELLSILEGE